MAVVKEVKMLLQGKVAIVTGGAQGIGHGIAARFLAEGANVVIGDICADTGQAVTGRLDQGASRCRFVPCDVGDRAQVENLIDATVETFGALDICVSNAGILFGAHFLELHEEDFDRVLRVNLKGPFLVGQAAARHMVQAGTGGAIINMSSINAVLAHADQIPYITSKGGLNQLTKGMALALADKGIRVNAIGPGSIMTDMMRKLMTDEVSRNRVLSRTPIGRLGTVDEIANIAVFLASDAASYITGQTIYADGGRLPLAYTVAAKS